MVRASVSWSREEVTRGTTSAVNTLHRLPSTRTMPTTRATTRATHAVLPIPSGSALTPGRAARAASRAAGGPEATSDAGTSTARERSNSPSPLACVSSRRFEATPHPSRPWTTKLTARRFGSG